MYPMGHPHPPQDKHGEEGEIKSYEKNPEGIVGLLRNFPHPPSNLNGQGSDSCRHLQELYGI